MLYSLNTVTNTISLKMESFMDFYFEEVFSNMNRDCLNEKFKRKELCEYFSTVIAGCAKGANLFY